MPAPIYAGASVVANTVINIAANLDAMHFSRQTEVDADHQGAITCAQAGVTPHGKAWILPALQSAPLSSPPEFISNHPSDAHRIGALESEFASDPSLFAKYNQQIACGTPLGYGGRCTRPAQYEQHRAPTHCDHRQGLSSGVQHDRMLTSPAQGRA